METGGELSAALDIARIKALLIRHEGLKLKPYVCSEGHLTIGVGRNLDQNGISAEEADYLLSNDIVRFHTECHSRFPWFCHLNVARKAVILSMAFNLGTDGVKGFSKMIEAIDARDWKRAADEMMNSKWRAQVGERARDLAFMMETGEFLKGD